MSESPLISIIVPIYKVEKYLDECVQSLVNQTYANLEIILVDDGSPDNCPLICDAWKERDSRIIVIHKSNGGLSDARNAGIKVASGRWLLFVDSDDVIPAAFVGLLVCATVNDDRLVVSGMERFVSDIPKCGGAASTPEFCGKDIAKNRGGLYCCGALYSRELINQLDLQFDASLRNIEDVVWNGIYLRYINEVIYVDVPYFYRMNPTSITSKCGNYRWQIASWIAARKSLMNWFADRPLTSSQQKEAAGMFRHCQNNIYAECVAGKVSFATLSELESQDGTQFCEVLISAPERFMRRCFPRLYYAIYVSLLRAKKRYQKQ